MANITLSTKTSRDKTKIWYYLEWGKGAGQRKATGVYTWSKPKDATQKQFNKEALAIVETKKSQLILEFKSAGTSYIPTHKFKSNFLEFYEDFVKNNEREGNRSLAASLSKFKIFLKEKERKETVIPSDITKNLCERFQMFLLDTLNGETPGDYFMRFKRVLATAADEGYYRKSPAESVPIKMHPSGVKETLDVDEFRRLLKAHCSNYEVKKAAVCSMYTGFRWCDVEPLQWWQIKTETIVLRKQSKTGVPLEVPLHPVVKAIIGERRAQNDLVFDLPTQDGANKVLGKWVKDEAKIDKHITWHCLRHTVSGILIDEGIDLDTVAAFLGQTTAKYVLKTYKKRVKAHHMEEASKKLPS